MCIKLVYVECIFQMHEGPEIRVRGGSFFFLNCYLLHVLCYNYEVRDNHYSLCFYG